MFTYGVTHECYPHLTTFGFQNVAGDDLTDLFDMSTSTCESVRTHDLEGIRDGYRYGCLSGAKNEIGAKDRGYGQLVAIQNIERPLPQSACPP